jgi:protein PsiE
MTMNSTIRNIQLVGVIFILTGTVVAFGFEINEMYKAQRVTLADLLLMFIYIEVIGMIGVFWESKTIRITYPLLIAITALARLIILQDKDSASVNLIYQGAAILLLAVAVFILKMRYSKKLGMDKRSEGEEA